MSQSPRGFGNARFGGNISETAPRIVPVPGTAESRVPAINLKPNEDEKERSCWKSVKTQISKRVGDEEFGKRLTMSWELTSSLAGFIAGFTYIVSIGNPEYEYKTLAGTKIERKPIYTVCVMISFILALMSTFLGLILIGQLRMIGEEHGRVLRSRHPALCDAPEQTIVAAVIFMIFATMLNTGGHTGTGVFTVCCGIATMFLCFMVYIYFAVMGNGEMLCIMDVKNREANENAGDNQ